jgi:hypothetical protein
MFGIGSNIGNMDDPTLKQGARDHGSSAFHKRLPPQECVPFGQHREAGRPPINFAHSGDDKCQVCNAQPRGGFADSIQHGLKIESRAADDLEHVAGRGLVFEGSPKIAGALGQFGAGLVELLLKLSHGPPKLGHGVVEHLGHLLIPFGPCSNGAKPCYIPAEQCPSLASDLLPRRYPSALSSASGSTGEA